jgi:hypothetical protein
MRVTITGPNKTDYTITTETGKNYYMPRSLPGKKGKSVIDAVKEEFAWLAPEGVEIVGKL